jgi:hypothetical protein
MVSMFAIMASMLAGGKAIAQLLPMCTANGLEATGDTTGLSLAPCPQPKVMDQLDVSDAPLDPVQQDPPPGKSNSTLFWGYEANQAFGASRLLAYHAVPGSIAAPQAGECIPSGPHISPVASNGRGLAFDPLDGNLWISRLTIFTGDQRIHKVTPPNVTPGICEEVNSLLVHYPGGLAPEQPAFGALDTDQGSKHIWAAGYGPVSIGGQLRNYFYLVNRNNGLIIQSCWIPGLPGFQANNSLAYARLAGLPGSGQYLVTDNDEFFNGDALLVIDTADCHKGTQVTPVAQFPKLRGMTGIDFEWLGFLYTELFQFWNGGDQPFTDNTYLGLTGTTYMEDISVCGFRAKFGGDGNDGCPYQ